MHLTSILLKPKAKEVLVVLKSVVSGHKVVYKRPRQGEKLEMVLHDPFIGTDSVYRELKKLTSL